MFIACQEGHVNIVKLLLDNKADIDKFNDKGMSPLFVACQENHQSVIQLLLNNKADINKLTNNETSPLFVLVRRII